MVNIHCIAEGCTNDSRKKKNFKKYPSMLLNGEVVEFFLLPSAKKNPLARKRWLSQIRRENFNPNPNHHWHALCSRHFVDGKPTPTNPLPTLFSYNNYKMGIPRKTINSDLRPVENIVVQSVVTVPSQQTLTPHKSRAKYVMVDIPVISCTPVPSLDHIYTFSPNDDHQDVSIEEKYATLMENNSVLEKKCKMFEAENIQLKDDVFSLQAKLKASEDENEILRDKLNNTDELLRNTFVKKITGTKTNVKNFLGMPSISLLLGIFKLLEGPASKMKYWTGPDSSEDKQWQENNNNKPGAARKLSFYEEFLITLLRLKLGLNTYLLATLFGISQPTVSRVFTSWICLIYQQFKSLIKWPSKQKIKRHMPLSFRKKYPNTRVIIDATEFYVQRPRNPTAQSKCWSNYKSKTTFKSLVGITPNGAFSFVSDLWTGNVSDRCITERSGFIDLIEKGDDVMADRGFLIKDLLLKKGATLNMPPFTRPCKYGKGKCLTAKEVKESKQIASLRIHVERAIQRLKSFKFLSSIIPVNTLYIANQAVKVAAIFCNLMKPLVKKH